MFLVVPLLALFVGLVIVAVWWLLGGGGMQLVLHQVAPTAAPPR